MPKSPSKTNANVIEIHSPRLSVGIALPGTNYQSTRFDYSSFAIDISLDGKHQFASAERTADNPLFSKGGQGLSCEFGIRAPIGYDDCPVGDWFPKLGVGFIRRESSQEYDFFHHYNEMRPLEYSFSHDIPADAPDGSQCVTITGKCNEYRGYAWSMSRTWLVYGTTVENRCTLNNYGSKTLETNEYSHNFIKLGDTPTGPDILLEFGFPLSTKPKIESDFYDPSHCFDGPRPIFKTVPEGEFFIGWLLDHTVSGAWWQAHNKARKLTVREVLNQPCYKCDIWGKSSVISPELFTNILVLPQKSFSWSRKYSFEAP